MPGGPHTSPYCASAGLEGEEEAHPRISLTSAPSSFLGCSQAPRTG